MFNCLKKEDACSLKPEKVIIPARTNGPASLYNIRLIDFKIVWSCNIRLVYFKIIWKLPVLKLAKFSHVSSCSEEGSLSETQVRKFRNYIYW